MSARFPPGPSWVTHVVLVDGLPVHSWVVTGADAGRYSDAGRYPDPDLGRDTDPGPEPYGWDDDRVPRADKDEAWSPDGDLGWDSADGLTTPSGYRESLGPPAPPPPSRAELRLLDLEELVGGADALTALDVEPLPAGPLDLQSVSPEVGPVVEEVLRLCGEVVDRWFDAEAHTVLHRLVAVIVAERPEVLADPDVALSAASLSWMVGRGNGFVGPVLGTHTVTNKALLQHFRQPANLVEAFAGRLLPKTPPSAGVDEWGRTVGQGWRSGRSRPSSGYLLGRPEWLVARRRLAIAAERDGLLRQLADRAAALAATSAGAVDPPLVETASGADDAPQEWERSLRLLSGPMG